MAKIDESKLRSLEGKRLEVFSADAETPAQRELSFVIESVIILNESIIDLVGMEDGEEVHKQITTHDAMLLLKNNIIAYVSDFSDAYSGEAISPDNPMDDSIDMEVIRLNDNYPDDVNE